MPIVRCSPAFLTAISLTATLALSACTGGASGGGAATGGASSGGSSGGGGFFDSLTGALSGSVSSAEIEKRHATEGKTAEGTIKLWLRACLRMSSASPLEVARGHTELTYLTIPFKDAADWDTRSSYRTFVTRLKEQPHIFRAYAKGATPQNAYAMNPESFEIEIARTAPGGEDRGTQVSLKTAGADNPRPVYMKQSTTTGLWYVASFDNLYVDVKKMVDPKKEQFK